MDQVVPLYQTGLDKKRILIPKTIILTLLSALFYIGILVNISLLKLDSNIESTAKFTGLGFVILIFILGVILNFIKAKQGIKFFNDHLEIGHQKIQYLSLNNVETKLNPLDKIFKTYTLNIDKKHKLEGISNQVNLQQYLQQMINYAKMQQQNQTQNNTYQNYNSQNQYQQTSY